MNGDEYQKLAARTEADPEQPRLRITGLFQSEGRSVCTPTRLIHAVMGMVTELGELADYGANRDEEEGDFMWYVALYCNARDLSLDRLLGLPAVPAKLTVAVGALTDVLKKHFFYGKPPDFGRADLAVAQAAQGVRAGCVARGTDFSGMLAANVAKLRARYPDKFTEHDALNRDPAKEAQALGTPHNHLGDTRPGLCPACDHEHEHATLSDDGNTHEPPHTCDKGE